MNIDVGRLSIVVGVFILVLIFAALAPVEGAPAKTTAYGDRVLPLSLADLGIR